MKNLELKDVWVTELTTIESALIDGGDVNGLMRSEGPTWDNFTTNVGYVAGFFVGIYRSLF